MEYCVLSRKLKKEISPNKLRNLIGCHTITVWPYMCKQKSEKVKVKGDLRVIKSMSN